MKHTKDVNLLPRYLLPLLLQFVDTIIGGDHNSHIGYGDHWEFARGAKGPFGMGKRDNSGTDFLQWREGNILCFADSFVSMEHRGTWFSRLQAKWYERDGVVLKNDQKRTLLEKIEVLKEDSLSDHGQIDDSENSRPKNHSQKNWEKCQSGHG